MRGLAGRYSTTDTPVPVVQRTGSTSAAACRPKIVLNLCGGVLQDVFGSAPATTVVLDAFSLLDPILETNKDFVVLFEAFSNAIGMVSSQARIFFGLPTTNLSELGSFGQ